MESPRQPGPEPWASASASEIAEAAGAADLFVFRRVGERRFAHLGGAGRGTGWAGIVEIGVDEEPLVAEMLEAGAVVRRSQREPWHVLGPYYGLSVAAVPVTSDVFVLFGSPGAELDALTDADLLDLARHAGESLLEVAPAKRLADELEVLQAVQDLLSSLPQSLDEALQRLVECATSSLSCDLGLAYIRDRGSIAVADYRDGAPLEADEVADTLAAIGERAVFPVCVQQASLAELPAPFGTGDGVLAYYLLELEGSVSGFLLLLHTKAGTARGFTLLCQSLGRKLVEAGEPLLATALLRDRMRAELERAEADARRDPLTGLANRLAWSEGLASASPCPGRPASIVKVDCRGLKHINETRGHGTGDRMLCRVAAILAGSIRPGDLASRTGGDEFSILLCDADEEAAAAIARRIDAAVENARATDWPELGLAIGTSTVYDDLAAAEQLADARMLESKRLGRTADAHSGAG
ncbi:MAG TPA: GGDEF domain-containing protein [Gaiellaceae bacterium]|jgi:diguanylate cyclase (GGDEF)-like protein|nr:GGDEF domain-containing protein [Gaiellaceae bacterium]